MVRLCSVWMVAIFITVVAKKSWSYPQQRSSSRATNAAHAFSSRHRYSSMLSRSSDRVAFAETGAAERSLQVTTATSPPSSSKCIDASSVNFFDEFSVAVYGSAYQATCTCTEETTSFNILDVLSTLPMPPDPSSATPDEIASYTATFNEQFSKIEGGYEFTCTSGCSTCFDNDAYCGFLVQYEEVSYTGTNFTFEEISTGQIFPDFTLDAETCMTYETGETGEVCFGVSTSGPLPVCTFRYNDVPCNSCEIIGAANVTTGCYRADCTNVVPDAMLDGCAMTGFVGPFRYFQVERNLSDVTLGTCNPSNTGGAASNGNPSPTPNTNGGATPTNGGATPTNGGANSTNGSSSSTGTGGSVITKLSILFAIVAGLF